MRQLIGRLPRSALRVLRRKCPRRTIHVDIVTVMCSLPRSSTLLSVSLNSFPQASPLSLLQFRRSFWIV
jgi:hypothetical protein